MSIPYVFVTHSPFYKMHIAHAVQNTREARRSTYHTFYVTPRALHFKDARLGKVEGLMPYVITPLKHCQIFKHCWPLWRWLAEVGTRDPCNL